MTDEEWAEYEKKLKAIEWLKETLVAFAWVVSDSPYDKMRKTIVRKAAEIELQRIEEEMGRQVRADAYNMIAGWDLP